MSETQAPEPTLTAREVAELLRLKPATIYEISRTQPESLGTVRLPGRRSVRFRRCVIDALVGGGLELAQPVK